MDLKQTACCTVLDTTSHTKYICYTRRDSDTFTVCLTDAADVWRTEYSQESLQHFRQRFALKSAEDYVLKLSSACGSGRVSVLVQGSRAELHAGPGADLCVTLSRLEAPQASQELKELLFNMAERLSPQSHTTCASPAVSPLKNHHKRPAEFEPRQQQQHSGPPSVPVKKRLPGASLINPGTKRKQKATGVAFDDADED